MPFTEVPAAHLSEEYDPILAEKGSTMLSPWRHLPFLLLVLTASTLVTSTWLRPADEQAHWLVESAARPSQVSDPVYSATLDSRIQDGGTLRMK